MITSDLLQADRLADALLSLDGLSVGDAFGQLLSTCARSARRVLDRDGLPSGPWWHTDDTQMAMAIVEVLAAYGHIDQDALAVRFAARYERDPGRGYGKGARRQLEDMTVGRPWQTTTRDAFGGRGSMGNGSAMRSAPLGAFFADDLDQLVHQSAQSSEITHSHQEGIAGSIAVSVAAAAAFNARCKALEPARACIWEAVATRTPPGETLNAILRAQCVPLDLEAATAARLLGSGFLVTAPDTVPFALWCACRHLDSYQDALLTTLEGDGDCDTNCAIVGGIVAMFVGRDGIPAHWLANREKLDLELV